MVTAAAIIDEGRRTMHKRFLLGLVILGLWMSAARVAPASAQGGYEWTGNLSAQLSGSTGVDWMRALRERILALGVNPPAAARLMGYAGVTIYESIVLGDRQLRSLDGQLNDLTNLPFPADDEIYHWGAVMDEAMLTVMSGLLPDDDSRAAFQSVYDAHEPLLLPILEDFLTNGSFEVPDDLSLEASVGYGKELGEALLIWAKADGYNDAHAAPYNLPVGDGLWELTTPNTRPVEPWMIRVRPFILESGYECYIPSSVPYSTDENSAFYAQAMEVFEVGNDLTPEQRATAVYWVDTPAISFTPGGHWMSIAEQMVTNNEATLSTAGQVFGMMGIALADAFSSAWTVKYDVNLLRPVTYINANINPRWRPFIESPPFPEYPSGHSVVSGAAGDMLTFLFGAVPFTDRTHEEDELIDEVRSFITFEQAAYEAAISRLYGGIHFRTAIENGLRHGRCVTEIALERIVMNQFTQGE
jgi:hypothetical protein